MKTDQLKNYWTEQGLAAKEANQKCKIVTITNSYTDKAGKVHTFTHKRHSKANEVKVTKPEIRKYTKEEYREFYKLEREAIKKNLESRPYSNYHNKLVASLYLAPNRLKQQALIAKHKKDLENMKHHIEQVKLRRKKEYDEKANNCIEIRKTDNKGNEYTFMTLHSNQKIARLKAIATKMVNEITMDTGTTTTADIYSKATYPLKYHVESLNREAA